MRRSIAISVLLPWMLAGPSIAPARETADRPSFKRQFKEQLDRLLPGMGAEKIPNRRDSQQQFQGICLKLGTPGRETERAAACEVIAEALGTKLAKPARIWLLRQLEYIGRDECVDAVAASLDNPDPHIRDAARRALQNIPVPQAGAKLRGKLRDAQGTWRVGLINSLGARGDGAAAGALADLLDAGDRAAAAAAANALGKIGGPHATKALAAALPRAPKQLKIPVADAYLRCADKLLAEGKKDEAMAIYKQLYAPDSPQAIRLAAAQGMLNAAGE